MRNSDEYNRDLMEAVWIDVFSVGVDNPRCQAVVFVCKTRGVVCATIEYTDIMLLDYLDTRFINHRDHSLKDIAQRLVGPSEIGTVIEEGAQKAEIEELLVGACCSIWTVLDQFTLSSEMNDVYQKIEKDCIPVLAGMEQAGIRVNVAQFSAFAKDIEGQLNQINEFMENEVGHPVNINSPKAGLDFTVQRARLTPSKKTKSGGSTDSTSLQLLLEQTDDPRYSKDFRYREIGKIKSTYLDALPTFVRDTMGASTPIYTKR